MRLTEEVASQMKAAMKAKDQDTLRALRGLKADFMKAQTAEGRAAGELSDEEAAKVVQKAVKQRKDSAEQYRANGREDLAAAEEAEITVLEHFLPKQLSPEEVKAEVANIHRELKAQGEVNLGQLMKTAMARLGAQADGKVVNQAARELLG